ncbi:MAG TPA: DotU family type IV/VI secretion system protein [Longimicrobiales bacterium]|nr:DotU family type IV/VI secretion system protein [Longimicrobiales bacterium]
MATLAPLPTTAPAPPGRAGRLALALQEAFTATVRLRTNRQVAPDAATFRAHIRGLVTAANQEALAAGYDRHLVKLAVHALIAFLDESVLNSTQPMFADWARQPLQEEVFGEHRAGETFFQNLRDLLARDDSQDLSDVLEVYALCLELGFRGRYSVGDAGELHYLRESARQKIERVRGRSALSPLWAPPSDETVATARDPWISRLVVVAGALSALALLLFTIYALVLRSGIGDIQALATEILR